MELRWVITEDRPRNGVGLYIDGALQDCGLALQYRDGVTHDAPWIDVPVYVPVYTLPKTE